MASFTDSSYEKTTLISPVSFYIEWKGGKDGGGFFQYYDKDLGENRSFELKDFIVLNTGYNVQGYVERFNTGAWSNQVDKLDEDLIVQTKQGVLVRGKYADIKNDLEGYGLKLHRVMQVLTSEGIIGIGLKGASAYEVNAVLSGVKQEDGTWSKSVDWRKSKIKFNGSSERKKGAVTYFVPTFVEGDMISPDEMEEAKSSAHLVNAYFEARRGEQKGLRETPEDDVSGDLPF